MKRLNTWSGTVLIAAFTCAAATQPASSIPQSHATNRSRTHAASAPKHRATPRPAFHVAVGKNGAPCTPPPEANPLNSISHILHRAPIASRYTTHQVIWPPVLTDRLPIVCTWLPNDPGCSSNEKKPGVGGSDDSEWTQEDQDDMDLDLTGLPDTLNPGTHQPYHAPAQGNGGGPMPSSPKASSSTTTSSTTDANGCPKY